MLLTNSTFLIKMFGAILVLSSLTEQVENWAVSPNTFALVVLLFQEETAVWSQFSKQLALIRSLEIF